METLKEPEEWISELYYLKMGSIKQISAQSVPSVKV